MLSVLFVCTANVCRSPMASAIFLTKLSQQGIADNWRVGSAGTWTVDGLPPAKNSELTISSLYKIDIQEHRSRSVDRELLNSFDLILTMERGHREAIKVEFPELAERVFLISEMLGEDNEIVDPVGGPILEYRQTARELDRILTNGFDRIRQLAEKNANKLGHQ